MSAKNILGNWASVVLGVGAIGAILYATMSNKERRQEREAFRKLDLGILTPKDIWDQALDFGRKRRTELSVENAEYKELVEHAAGLIEISEGLQKCAVMLADRSVPEEVKVPICTHWYHKWWEFMGFDVVLMKSLFDRLDADFVQKFRKKFEEYDKREEVRKAREQLEQKREYTKADLSCSFCGKSAKEVEKLIAGPAVYICNECVELCDAILVEERAKAVEAQLRADAAAKEELAKLQAIETEEQHKAALAEIERLMAAQDPEDADRLKKLAALVESYEKEHFPIESPTPEEALRFQLEQSEARVKELENELEALQYEAKEEYPDDDGDD